MSEYKNRKKENSIIFLGISRNFDYKNQINLFYWNNQNFVKFMVGETVQIIHRTISR